MSSVYASSRLPATNLLCCDLDLRSSRSPAVPSLVARLALRPARSASSPSPPLPSLFIYTLMFMVSFGNKSKAARAWREKYHASLRIQVCVEGGGWV